MEPCTFCATAMAKAVGAGRMSTLPIVEGRTGDVDSGQETDDDFRWSTLMSTSHPFHLRNWRSSAIIRFQIFYYSGSLSSEYLITETW